MQDFYEVMDSLLSNNQYMLFWVNVSFITLDLVKAIMVCGIGTYQPIFLHVGLLVGYWQGPTKIEVASVLNFR